jgi:hypothetical protein
LQDRRLAVGPQSGRPQVTSGRNVGLNVTEERMNIEHRTSNIER